MVSSMSSVRGVAPGRSGTAGALKGLLPSCLLLVAGLGVPVAAQIYSPAPLAHHEGVTATGFPFGYASTTKMVYQQVHGDLPATPSWIRNLSLRPRVDSASHSGFSTTGTMTLGVDGPTPAKATNNFNSNLGPYPQVVLNRTSIKMPSYTAPQVAPPPFVYTFPFSRPFFYNGKGVLAWQYVMTSHTQRGRISLDLFYHRFAPYLQTGGRGCTAYGKVCPMTLAGSFDMTRSLRLSCSEAPSGPGLLLMVGNRNRSYGGLTLPFDLGPFGAACALRTSVELLLPPTHGTSWSVALPKTAPSGTALYLQAIAPDPKANGLGLVLSNGLAAFYPYTFATRPCIHVWKADTTTATTGFWSLDFGQVVKFGT